MLTDGSWVDLRRNSLQKPDGVKYDLQRADRNDSLKNRKRIQEKVQRFCQEVNEDGDATVTW